MKHQTIPTLQELRQTLGCQEKTAQGVCWYECNTAADKAVLIFHGVTGGKIDMMPLAERYVGFGYAVYAVDLPGHGGSVQPELQDYQDLGQWFTHVVAQIGRTPDVVIGTSFSASVVYYAMSTGIISPQTKIILACPTPDTTKLADILQKLSSKVPEKVGWDAYNLKVAQYIRVAAGLKTQRRDARQWLRESETYKKNSLTLRDSAVLTTLLYNQSPYAHRIPQECQRNITVIVGGKDNIITSKTLDIMHELLPEADFICAPQAGHLLQFEAVESYPDVAH